MEAIKLIEEAVDSGARLRTLINRIVLMRTDGHMRTIQIHPTNFPLRKDNAFLI